MRNEAAAIDANTDLRPRSEVDRGLGWSLGPVGDDRGVLPANPLDGLWEVIPRHGRARRPYVS